MSNRSGQSFKQQQMQMGIVIKPQLTDWKTIAKEKLHFNADECPCCKKGKMMEVLSFDNNGPPAWALLQTKYQAEAVKRKLMPSIERASYCPDLKKQLHPVELRK